MADERTSNVRATRELDPAKLSPSLFSLFPPVRFNCRFTDQAPLGVRSVRRFRRLLRRSRCVLNDQAVAND